MKLKRLLLLLFISVSLFGCASNSNLADDKKAQFLDDYFKQTNL